jgi:hypothetical protein
MKKKFKKVKNNLANGSIFYPEMKSGNKWQIFIAVFSLIMAMIFILIAVTNI